MKLTEDYLQYYVHKFYLYDPDSGLWIDRYSGKCKWTKVRGRYQIRMFRNGYYIHRLVFIYMIGHWPKGEVDHLNTIRTDNRWCNLRDVNHATNQRNCKRDKRNKSGISGLRKRPNGSWSVRIGKQRLGVFETQIIAAQVRLQAEIEHDYNINRPGSALHYLVRKGVI